MGPQVKFSYFVNTKALKCLAFGPGLLEEGTWGLPMLFMIQAKDGTGRNRTSGGDPFKVTVVDSAGNPTSLINIKDNDNGARHARSLPRSFGGTGDGKMQLCHAHVCGVCVCGLCL